MDISAACSPPIQPALSDADLKHPRYSEYSRYRSVMSRQLVEGLSFKAWLRSTEERENGREIVYQVTSTTAKLAPGWYKNKFAPNAHWPRTCGPFATQADAEAA